MKVISYLWKKIVFSLARSISVKNLNNFPQIGVFSFDYISLKIMIFGRFEDEHLAILESEILSKIDPKTYCLDIGANIGNHSLVFSKYFSETHAFEPNLKTFKLLKFNSTNAPNVIPHNIGASNKNELSEAIDDDINIGISRIIENNSDKQLHKTTQFDCRILDEYLPDTIAHNVGLIKIDVEGHELPALQGCKKILEHSKPIVVFELLRENVIDHKSDVMQYLIKNGYSYFYEIYNKASLIKGIRQISQVKRKNYKMIVASYCPIDSLPCQ